jgi:hypothetical protein
MNDTFRDFERLIELVMLTAFFWGTLGSKLRSIVEDALSRLENHSHHSSRRKVSR